MSELNFGIQIQAKAAVKKAAAELKSLEGSLRANQAAATQFSRGMRFAAKHAGADSKEYAKLEAAHKLAAAAAIRDSVAHSRAYTSLKKATSGATENTAALQRQISVKRAMARATAASARSELDAARAHKFASHQWNAGVRRRAAMMRTSGNQAANVQAGPGVKSMALGFGVASLALGALRRAGQAAREALSWFGRKSFEAAEFADSIQFAMSKFLGGGEAARRELGNMRAMANELGLEYRDVATEFKRLISASYDPAQAKELIRLKADMMATSGGGKKAVQLIEEAYNQLAKAMTTGRMNAKGLHTVLAGMPNVNKGQVMAKLAELAPELRKAGQSAEEFHASLMKAAITKLPIEKLVKAITAAGVAGTGSAKAGDVAAESLTKSWSGAYKALKNTFSNSFDDIGANMIDSQAAIDMMNRIRAALTSPEFKDALTSVGTGIGKIAEGLLAAEPVARSFATGLSDGFDAATASMKETEKMFGPLTADDKKDALQGLAYVARVIGTAFGLAAGVIGRVSSAISILSGWSTKILGVWGSIGESAMGIGGEFVDGIIAGITGAGGRLMEAMRGLADRAMQAAKDAFQIQSPSRRAKKEIGAYLPPGIAEGVDQEAGVVDRAMTRVADGSISAAASTAQSSKKPTASHGAIHLTIENITIGTAATDGRAMARDFRVELAKLLETQGLTV